MTEAILESQERRPRLARLRSLADHRLAGLVAAGDRQAFVELFQRYQEGLYRQCRSLVGDAGDAKEALEETTAKALRALENGEADLDPRPWLYRLARNRARALARERGGAAEDAPFRPGPELAPETRERLRELITDLNRLTQRQRGALLMHELDGLDFAEIATIFLVSEGTARQAVFQARLAVNESGAGDTPDCPDIRASLAAGDRRTARSRRIRSHLRECPECSGYAAALHALPDDLRALFPALLAWEAERMLRTVAGREALRRDRGGWLAAAAVALGVLLLATGAAIALIGGGGGGERQRAATPAVRTSPGEPVAPSRQRERTAGKASTSRRARAARRARARRRRKAPVPGFVAVTAVTPLRGTAASTASESAGGLGASSNVASPASLSRREAAIAGYSETRGAERVLGAPPPSR
jgi:RNA polymerase sigma factor (sigma-70 family)